MTCSTVTDFGVVRYITDMPNSLDLSGESRYLTPLLVFGNGDPTVTNLELGADRVDSDHQQIKIKIVAALKLLTFREKHVLLQYWSPRVVGKHQLLTTTDEPIGLGVIDVGLCSYRRDSERRSFVVEEEHDEEDRSPAARVFRRGMPEWTYDLHNYTSKQFPQQECAIQCNLHGYLALPVFESNTGSCVGVLELLTSSKYKSYAYEVQQLQNALETVGLRTQKAFDCSILNVLNEHRKKDFEKIYRIMKTVCNTHSLPLAQTWTVSQHSSFVSHEKVIKKSCSSFDSRCVGKVCMFTADLAFYVKDLDMWSFRDACRERHLDRSHGFVGKALLSRGSCFCGDVTKLSEEEYPLVHNARMNRLTSCFAIFLHSVEADDDYVLEFFLQPDIKDSARVKNLVQTLKQKIETASGFELGDTSDIQVVGPPTEVGKSSSIDPHTIQISSITTTNNNKVETVTSDSESIMVHIANKTESSANVSNEWPSYKRFGLAFAVFLMVRVKRWSCSIKRHGFSGKWWSCGMHTYLPYSRAVSDSTAKPKYKTNNMIPYSCVAESILVHASPKHSVANISNNILDIQMVTVKATFNEDMIKFQFPTSSGLLELEHEVVRRIKLKSIRPRLKYRDEDNDLILLACDADLRSLLISNHGTVKLIIVDDD